MTESVCAGPELPACVRRMAGLPRAQHEQQAQGSHGGRSPAAPQSPGEAHAITCTAATLLAQHELESWAGQLIIQWNMPNDSLGMLMLC